MKMEDMHDEQIASRSALELFPRLYKWAPQESFSSYGVSFSLFRYRCFNSKYDSNFLYTKLNVP